MPYPCVTPRCHHGVRSFRRLQNGSFERRGINAAGLAIDNFAFRADEHGVGHGTRPIRIKGIDERIAVRGAKNEIMVRSLLFFQEFRHGRHFIRLVHGHGHQFKIPMALYPVEGNDFGKFRYTGRAPRRPKIHHPEFAGLVLAQSPQGVGVRR